MGGGGGYSPDFMPLRTLDALMIWKVFTKLVSKIDDKLNEHDYYCITLLTCLKNILLWSSNVEVFFLNNSKTMPHFVTHTYMYNVQQNKRSHSLPNPFNHSGQLHDDN